MQAADANETVEVRLTWRGERSVEPRIYSVRTEVIIGGRTDAAPEEIPLGYVRLVRFNVEDAVAETGYVSKAFVGARLTGSHLFDYARNEYLPAVARAYRWLSGGHGDVLLVERFLIEPPARGHRLGIAVLHRVIREYADGCDLVFLKPFPLQFGPNARMTEEWRRFAFDRLPQSREIAFASLRDYYARFGFVPLGDGDHFVLSPDEYLARSHVERAWPEILRLTPVFADDLRPRAARPAFNAHLLTRKC